jgi:rod shape-determining protein MreD
VVVGGLILLHFGLTPWLVDRRIAPDLMLTALMIFSMRSSPGASALAGFVIGLVADSIEMVGFGSGALTHTVVGYVASWGRVVFFAENLLVNFIFFFTGSWLRDLLMLTAGGLSGSAIVWQLLVWSVLKGITTAIVGLVVLVTFRRWLNIRITH